MNVLVINCGSSSLKYQLIDSETEAVLAKGLCERIGIDSRKLRELRELVWVGQAYNLLLAGGSGTGKTYIAAGLVHEAVKAGYRAYMVTLEDLLTCLKTRDVSRHAMKTYKRIMKAQLLAIDNATLFPLKREDVMLLFKLVNEFQEKTSLIVTANYSLTE